MNNVYLFFYGAQEFQAINQTCVKRRRPTLKTTTILSISAVHQPFYISICISTLLMQHTTFIFNKLGFRYFVSYFAIKDLETKENTPNKTGNEILIKMYQIERPFVAYK